MWWSLLLSVTVATVLVGVLWSMLKAGSVVDICAKGTRADILAFTSAAPACVDFLPGSVTYIMPGLNETSSSVKNTEYREVVKIPKDCRGCGAPVRGERGSCAFCGGRV